LRRCSEFLILLQNNLKDEYSLTPSTQSDPLKGFSMRFFQSRKFYFFIGAILLVVLTAIGFFLFGNNDSDGTDQPVKQTSESRPSGGFTFFDIGPTSIFSGKIREVLEKQLGPSVLETNGLIDLTIKYRSFFERNFPDLFRLHMRLNDETGARVEHNIIKLTFRYAQRKNTPFFYVELIFSNFSKKPLFFRIKSKKEGAIIVDKFKKKYGKSMRIDQADTEDTTLYWKDNKDYLVVNMTKDRFGAPEFHIMIYYVENIEELISTEEKEKSRQQEVRKKAGQIAF